MKSGIYKISSIKFTDRIYIGSSTDFKRRKNEHFARLERNKHHSIILQNHYNKYGKKDLKFSIIEYCNENDLLTTEQSYLDSNKTYFNVCKTAGNSRGVKQSDKTKRKRSRALKSFWNNNTMSDDRRKSISVSNSKHSRERYGIIKSIENGFRVIKETSEVGDRRRVILAECPTCKSQKEYHLQQLRKRIQKNCGCINCTHKQEPLIASKWRKPKMNKRELIDRQSKRNDNTSGWIGVVRQSCKEIKWRARIKNNGKIFDVGTYQCPTVAAIQRDKYIIEHSLPHKVQIIRVLR